MGSIGRVGASIILALAVIFLVPVAVYGSLASAWGLETPEGASFATFLVSVLVSKTGTAVAFVLLYAVARGTFRDRWLQ